MVQTSRILGDTVVGDAVNSVSERVFIAGLIQSIQESPPKLPNPTVRVIYESEALSAGR